MGSGENVQMKIDSSNKNNTENDESESSYFVDAQENPGSLIPTNSNSISTGSEPDLAKDEEIGMKHYLKTVKAEQRVRYLGNLAFLGVGTNRVETNQVKSSQVK